MAAPLLLWVWPACAPRPGHSAEVWRGPTDHRGGSRHAADVLEDDAPLEPDLKEILLDHNTSLKNTDAKLDLLTIRLHQVFKVHGQEMPVCRKRPGTEDTSTEQGQETAGSRNRPGIGDIRQQEQTMDRKHQHRAGTGYNRQQEQTRDRRHQGQETPGTGDTRQQEQTRDRRHQEAATAGTGDARQQEQSRDRRRQAAGTDQGQEMHTKQQEQTRDRRHQCR
ncbi:hypothetical protein NDU88_005046 [Pleurodeles waltl]|uniref:Uncharacterized protein n=1 Tax=Pleurodeles waltl TaxID=8319 RepID=A0AAV7V3G7_PLEWA|nr:hypothetical protein NDU88_005046 [Pleurodeles waltl]